MIQSNLWKKMGLGQLFMVGFHGTTMTSQVEELISSFGISKFIIFSRNIGKDPGALKTLCRRIKARCQREGLRPIISVDQEGGPVARLRPPLFPKLPAPGQASRAGNPEDEIAYLAKKTASLLKGVSIDMNLAPVLDLGLSGASHVLKDRCLGSIPATVARLGRIYITNLRACGILAVGKHFPGIGRIHLDPHLERPTVTAPRDKILEELFPFKEAIRAGVDCLMTSHVVYEALDPENPATFSRVIARELLRGQLGFTGPLITDDLEMQGVMKYVSVGQATVRSFLAGHDILLICNDPSNIKGALDTMEREFKRGTIRKRHVDEAIWRIEGLRTMQVG